MLDTMPPCGASGFLGARNTLIQQRFHTRQLVVFLRLLEKDAAMECYGSGCGLIQYPSEK